MDLVITELLTESLAVLADVDWTATSAIATAVGALVTAATMIFIARQTSATRRSADEAKRSADAAYKTLGYSQKQQDYSAAQHRQSLFMATEAIKARIDADMPRITVTELRCGTPTIIDSSIPRPLPGQLSVHTHGALKIRYTVAFSLHNDGNRNVEVSFGAPVGLDGAETQKDKTVVAPGASREVKHQVTRTLAEWVVIFNQRQSGVPGDVDRLEIRYRSDADTGAHDNQFIETGGVPIEPSAVDPVHWQLGGQLGAGLMPAVRTYYLSRYANRRLPDIAWDDKLPSSVSADAGDFGN
ncbi:hypothetical protein [Pseudarthrobacter sp. AL07]|uniref:hypothetical protein n=1 Tax=Pseudarthrobacter sp. AL07 TaxID=3042233 RepID=UPI00249A9B77|nr:hypothetical protein [Pseudarthrobacter sp. AL07]